MARPADTVIATPALWLYRAASRAAGPAVRYHLRRRIARGREDPARMGERLGIASKARPAGALIWIHAASVGECVSALPLIERLRRDWPGLSILLTSGTVTSARLMGERLPTGVLHQFAPVDLPGAVQGFFDAWRPDLGLIIESELWPNLLVAAQARAIDLVLVNGRMSGASFAGWRRVRPVARRLLQSFSLVLAQSPEDQARFRDLGAADALCLGNLKFAAPPLAADAAELCRLQDAMGQRPCWLAASTHPGEEEAIGRAHAALAPRQPGLLTILAPRHPQRGPAIATRLRAAGHRVARRGDGDPITPATDIYVADTIGEMGLWYRLADIVFIGGSLVPKGGQNPLEAARLNCAIVCGPHTGNFRRVGDEMVQERALRRVSDGAALTEIVGTLLSDAPARQRLAAAAAAHASAQAGVLDGIVAALAPHLDRIAHSGKVSA